MMPANSDYCQPLLKKPGSRKKVLVLRDGLKQLRRAPPPLLKKTEEEVNLNQTNCNAYHHAYAVGKQFMC